MVYSYYDTPEGQDCFPKLWCVTKNALAVGFTLSFYDVLMITRPKGYLNTIRQMTYVIAPCVAMGAAFATVTCAATTLRKKDDVFNYMIGGVAAGSVLGAYRGCSKVGWFASGVFALTACLTKIGITEKWNMYPNTDEITVRTPLRMVDVDFTLLKDPRK